jgi:hypothetical protein
MFICFCYLYLLLHSPVVSLPLYVGPRKNILFFVRIDFLDFVMRPPSNGECDKNNSVQLTSSDPTAVIPVSTICGNNSMVSAFEAQSLHLQQYQVLRIRIRMFLGLPDPDPLVPVRGMFRYPDPSINKQK